MFSALAQGFREQLSHHAGFSIYSQDVFQLSDVHSCLTWSMQLIVCTNYLTDDWL
jgi:membrane protein DedA with SNARE-associated domain